MSKVICVELYCQDCGHEERLDHSEYECLKCGSTDVYNSRFITCDCGATVYLSGHTCDCSECGKLYNGFGQELAPPDEWDEEDRYATFSPQNDDYYY